MHPLAIGTLELTLKGEEEALIVPFHHEVRAQNVANLSSVNAQMNWKCHPSHLFKPKTRVFSPNLSQKLGY